MQYSVSLLTEAAKLADNLTIMGQDVEIFKDPTSASEMISALSPERRRRPDFRVLVTSKSMYYWDEWAEALHISVRRKLGLSEQPLHGYIAIDPATKRVYFSVAWTSLGAPFADMEDAEVMAYVKKVIMTQNPSIKAMKAVFDEDSSYQMSR